MSLYKNINKRKAEGTSRSKAKSTISDKSYSNMKAGFPKKKKKSDGQEMQHVVISFDLLQNMIC